MRHYYRASSFGFVADVRFRHRAKVVVVGQTHRFDSESSGDILILYTDQVVAVVLFAYILAVAAGILLLIGK
jgi:hypothetical protein